jgi:hypothetical protein
MRSRLTLLGSLTKVAYELGITSALAQCVPSIVGKAFSPGSFREAIVMPSYIVRLRAAGLPPLKA